ncbi:MAG: hypothetical protein ABGZ08_06130, partial [Akkermansiaceae bacterium]
MSRTISVGDYREASFMPDMNSTHHSVAHPLLTFRCSTRTKKKDAKANTKNDKTMAAHLSGQSLRRIRRIKRRNG